MLKIKCPECDGDGMVLEEHCRCMCCYETCRVCKGTKKVVLSLWALKKNLAEIWYDFIIKFSFWMWRKHGWRAWVGYKFFNCWPYGVVFKNVDNIIDNFLKWQFSLDNIRLTDINRHRQMLKKAIHFPYMGYGLYKRETNIIEDWKRRIKEEK